MPVANQKESPISPAEKRIRLAQPAGAQHIPNPEHDDAHDHDDHHGGGIERVEVLRVAFVALAAVAVWFRWWEPSTA